MQAQVIWDGIVLLEAQVLEELQAPWHTVHPAQHEVQLEVQPQA